MVPSVQENEEISGDGKPTLDFTACLTVKIEKCEDVHGEKGEEE